MGIAARMLPQGMMLELGWGAKLRDTLGFDARYDRNKGVHAAFNGEEAPAHQALFNPTWSGRFGLNPGSITSGNDRAASNDYNR
jgi:hypothetical protein